MLPFILRCHAILLFVVTAFLLPRIAFNAEIKIAWDPNTEPDLAGYKVYLGTASGDYGAPIDAGNVTTYTLPGLTEGQIYFIAVTAYDTSSNESGYSNEVNGAASEPVQTCTVATDPGGLQVVVDGMAYTSPQTFSWEAGSSHILSVDSPQNVTSGERYIYASWSDGGGQSHTVVVPPAGATYTASFTTQYSLITAVNPLGGGSVTPSGTNWYESGQVVPVSASANSGYSFSNWTGDVTGATNPASVTMSGPKSVTANFTQNQYTLAVGANPSGSGSVTKSPDKATYVYGESVTLTAVPNAGYAFSSWSGDASGTTNPYALTISGNRSVTASFVTVGSLVVTPSGGLSSSGYQGGPFSSSNQSYTLQNTGETSINWSVTKTQGWVSLSSGSGSLGAGASTTVEVSINGGADSLSAGSYSDTVTFSNVTNGSGNTSRSVALTVNVPVQTCTVATSPAGLQVVVDGMAYTSPKVFSWEVGSSHTVSVSSPQSGASGVRYAHSSWSDGGGQSHSITVPSSSATYTASFMTQYSLATSVSPSGTGSVTPSGTNWYESGQVVAVSASANTGYSFRNWTGDVAGATNPASVTMSGPKSVTANFTQNQFTLAVGANPSGSGSVTKSPDKATYVYGDSVILTASANAGYTFTGWSGDASGTTNPCALTINGNKSVTANFSAIPETVSAPTTPTGPSNGITGTSYAYSTGGSFSNLGHSVEYQFDWKGDGSDLSPWGSTDQSKAWAFPGVYAVRVRARCATHTSVFSSWSPCLFVFVKGVPSIRLANPTGGEVFKIGSTQKLSWVSENLDSSGKVHLFYFTDNGWQKITELPPHATSYYWTVPNTPMPATFMRIGNWVGGDWECLDSTKRFFTISTTGGGFAEGGWVFDILDTDKGGAAIWFEDNKFMGYGLSFGYGFLAIEGTYEIGGKGMISGSYSLYDFDHVTERERGSFIAKTDKKGTKLTMALQTSDGDPSSLTMNGRLLLSDPAIPEKWVAEITGGRRGRLDPLEIEHYQIDDQVYPRFFRIFGPGFISDAGPIEMNGYFILTSRNIAYGIYEMTGAVSDTGVFSGKLDPVSGKFKLKAMSDEGVSYIQTGIVKP